MEVAGATRQIVRRRQYDDGNGCEPRICQLFRAERPTVHDRHHQIEKDDRRQDRRSAQQLERLTSVTGGFDFEAFVAQQVSDRFAQSLVILDDEDSIVRPVVHALVDEMLNTRDELIKRTGFRYERVAAGGARSLELATRNVAGEHHDGYFRRPWIGLHQRGSSDAIHSTKVVVHDDDIWFMLERLTDGVLATISAHDRESGARQYVRIQLVRKRIVLDEQNTKLLRNAVHQNNYGHRNIRRPCK